MKSVFHNRNNFLNNNNTHDKNHKNQNILRLYIKKYVLLDVFVKEKYFVHTKLLDAILVKYLT